MFGLRVIFLVHWIARKDYYFLLSRWISKQSLFGHLYVSSSVSFHFIFYSSSFFFTCLFCSFWTLPILLTPRGTNRNNDRVLYPWIKCMVGLSFTRVCALAFKVDWQWMLWLWNKYLFINISTKLFTSFPFVWATLVNSGNCNHIQKCIMQNML
jgi:hypothetical protein